MSKEIKFYITDFRDFHNIVNSPIRNKEDIIKVLLFSLKNLLIKQNNEDEDKGEVRIIVDRSSRIYFVCKEVGELPTKYYSFVFPFFIQQDSELIDKLIVLLDKGWFSDNNINSDDIDKFACDYLDEIDDYCNVKGTTYEEKSNIYISHWSIIKVLLTFEPSYLRYDYDPEYENGESHPLNHLDIHYTREWKIKRRKML